MSIKHAKLVQGTLVSDVRQTLYTAGSKTRAIITLLTATNSTGVPTSLSLWIVQSGETTLDDHLILNGKEIAAQTADRIQQANHTLEPGDYLVARAGTKSTIAVQVSGLEDTK